MAISAVRVFPVAYPEPHSRNTERYLTLVRIEDDEGHAGWGEGISQFPEATRAATALIEGGLAELLLGGDPLRIQELWQRMVDRAFWYGTEGIAAFAISALDMALWDLKGHILEQPVVALLGGQVTDKALAMASIVFDMEDIAWTVDQFKSFQAQGYRMVKAGWGMTPEAQFGMNRKRDLRMVESIREAIGYEQQLVVDLPGHRRLWDLSTARLRFRELEPFQLRWIEQPLLPADLDAHARLRESVATPIGTGEDEWNAESYKRLIDSGGVDVVQLDPGRCLGITGSRQVIRLIEAAHLEVSAHTWSSALNTAASLHLLAHTPCAVALDFKPYPSPMQHELVTDPWVQEDGFLAVRDRPGLGVQVNEAIVAKYAWR